MAVYTRHGDQGFTRLVGGAKVKKNDPRVETYGSIDTLNAQVGFTVSLLEKGDPLHEELQKLQQWIFNCGSDFAVPDESRPYKLKQTPIDWLEEKIDSYWEELPKIGQFIIPGGTQVAGSLHLCRCFTREAERRAVVLAEIDEKINPLALKFLNRLSDCFFVLARQANVRENEPEVFYKDSAPVFSKKRGSHVSDNDESEA